MAMRDREDAVARALDLLPEGDPARSDPRLLRDPELAEEARLARETAADVWLAVSPLRAAPPAVLDEVMSEIGAPAKKAKSSSGLRWFAAGGWAAAFALGGLWWLRGDAGGGIPAGTAAVPDAEVIVEKEFVPARPAPPRRSAADGNLREEVARLRAALSAERGGRGFRPHVISLRSPMAEPRGPEEDRERLLSVLTNALRTALEVRGGATGDPASLVIERGWLPEGFVVPEDGLVRHRNFPESEWIDLGLLRSDEGNYYDPGSGLVWTADEEGRGFVGRRATEADNLDLFSGPDGSEPPVLAVKAGQPEGFVIADAGSGTSQVLLDGLSATPAGFGRWLVWTDQQGRMSETMIPYDVIGTSLIQLPAGATDFGSFQVIERPVVPNGSASTVILDIAK